MVATTVLRALVITEVVLLAASVSTLLLPSEVTPAIDDYLAGPGAGPLSRLVDGEPSAGTFAYGAVLVVFIATYIASLIGLLCLKSWSRRLYVVSFLLGACFYPLSGTSLVDPISGTVDYLAAVCSGAILATLFLSDARAIFDVRTPNTSLERTRDR